MPPVLRKRQSCKADEWIFSSVGWVLSREEDGTQIELIRLIFTDNLFNPKICVLSFQRLQSNRNPDFLFGTGVVVPVFFTEYVEMWPVIQFVFL